MINRKKGEIRTEHRKILSKILKKRIGENQTKLDKLVSAYIDDNIPKESYLKIKEELVKEKLLLNQRKQDFEQKGKNWIEPLWSFILDTKKANELAFSDD